MPSDEPLSIRFETGTRARIERIRTVLEKKSGGLRVTRANVIKIIVEEGCKVVEGRLNK
jgi:hypothetical protein